MLRNRIWLFASVMLIAIATALVVSVLADRQARLVSNQRFTDDSAVVSKLITDRINNYTNLLYGARGLFNSSDQVTKQEWQEFAVSTKISDRYPGLSTFFYAKVIGGEDYQLEIQDISGRRIDWSNFVSPLDNIVISYVFPEDEERSAALGYPIPLTGEQQWFVDPLSNEEPKISRVTYISAVSDNLFFAIIIPISTAEPEYTAEGLVGMSFRLQPLFSQLFASFQPRGEVRFVLLNSWDQELYKYNSSLSLPSEGFESSTVRQLVLEDVWTLEFEYEPYYGLDDFEKLIPVFLGVFSFMLVMLVIGSIVFFYIIRAEQLRERSEKLRAEFISIISHQLRTPMTSIKWTLDMLREDPNLDDKERDKLLTDVYASSQRVIDITNDLLQLSRLETNRQKPPQLDKASINKIISDAITACAGDAKQREIQVLVESQMTDLSYCVDRSQLLQVLTNILGNAVKYSRPNTNVTVKLEEAEKSYNLMVIDNGIGIPRKEMSQLFTKFFRASNAASLNTDGTGIGLFIAKSLAELNGLNILVESNEGSGSIFTIQLPKSTDC